MVQSVRTPCRLITLHSSSSTKGSRLNESTAAFFSITPQQTCMHNMEPKKISHTLTHTHTRKENKPGEIPAVPVAVTTNWVSRRYYFYASIFSSTLSLFSLPCLPCGNIYLNTDESFTLWKKLSYSHAHAYTLTSNHVLACLISRRRRIVVLLVVGGKNGFMMHVRIYLNTSCTHQREHVKIHKISFSDDRKRVMLASFSWRRFLFISWRTFFVKVLEKENTWLFLNIQFFLVERCEEGIHSPTSVRQRWLWLRKLCTLVERISRAAAGERCFVKIKSKSATR